MVGEGVGREGSKEPGTAGSLRGAKMGEGLRVLLVEDVEDDAFFATRELKRAGLVVDSRRVRREEDFLRDSGEIQPHPLLSGFEMPAFDGRHPVAISPQADPAITFLFLSRTI